MAAEGIECVCDWINDDLLYPMKAKHGSIHSMPLSHEIDGQTIVHGYQHSEADFVRQVRDAFEVH